MTNPNDMTQWDEIRCQRGCTDHPTREVHVSLGGPTRYRDLPSIPRPLSTEFDFLIWDTDQTPVDGGPYCPARDAVSETILSHGVWEPTETIVMLDCFRREPGNLFVDIGAQLGWFSTLAVRRGLPVVAVEADLDVCRVLERNLRLGFDDLILDGEPHQHGRPVFYNIWPWRVDDDPEAICPSPGTEPGVTAKIDVEGAEPAAVEMLFRSFRPVNIDFMLIEISPVFHDGYPDMVRKIIGHGFAAALLPEKSIPPPHLNTILNLDYRADEAFADEVADWHQKNVLFVREALL